MREQQLCQLDYRVTRSFRIPLSISVDSGHLEPVQDRVYAIAPEGESCFLEYDYDQDYRLRAIDNA